MQIKLKEQKEDTVSVTLEAKMVDGELQISDTDAAWSVAAFRVVDGKLNIVRYTGISDNNYNTNKQGQIVEVEE